MLGDRFQYLLDKFKTGALSAAEEQEWRKMIRHRSFRSAVKRDIETMLRSRQPCGDWNTEVEEETWKQILAHTAGTARSPKDRLGSVLPKRHLLFASFVAAFFCLLVVLCIPDGKKAASRVSVSIPEASAVLLGSTQAVITLSGGEKIMLDSFAHKQLATQGCVTVTQLTGGKLVYTASKTPGLPLYNTLETLPGGKYELQLSDRTTVWLSPGSHLRYSTIFEDPCRTVELKGEAYFEEAPGANSALSVTTKDGKVYITGTHFDLKSYPGDDASCITLLTGGLRVAGPGGSLILRKGHEVIIKAGLKRLVLRSIHPGRVIAWKNELLSFYHTPLSEVARQLQRCYNVTLKYGKSVHNLPISGDISLKTGIADALKRLFGRSGIRYALQGRQVTLDAFRPTH